MTILSLRKLSVLFTPNKHVNYATSSNSSMNKETIVKEFLNAFYSELKKDECASLDTTECNEKTAGMEGFRDELNASFDTIETGSDQYIK